MSRPLLLVDDDQVVRMVIRNFLSGAGFEVHEADCIRTALTVFEKVHPEIVLLDVFLPDGNALELVSHLKKLAPETAVLVLTANASIDLAVRAIKEGAEHFLTKPVDFTALKAILDRLIERQRRDRRLAVGNTGKNPALNPFLGTSRAIQVLRDQAGRLAATDRPVLLWGETGTGKGVLARWIHDHGPRAEEPFVDLNCAGFVREFFESDLFGHQKGAFTGAVAEKKGLLEVAHLGTVFLDEIGDVDATVQPKLLKVIEEKQFRRVGDVRDRRVDIRLISATHRDLARMSEQGEFREDLYFRIGTLTLRIPPLRERLEDLPELTRMLIENTARDLGHRTAGLSSRALRALAEGHWRGNIRELRNTLERAVMLTGRAELDAEDLEFRRGTPVAAPPRPNRTGTLGDALETFEREFIQDVWREEAGQAEAVIRRIGVSRSTFYDKVKRLGIDLKAFSEK
jgi:DNA-binding NtrC family response regulator